MRAARITTLDGPEAIEIGEVDDVVPEPAQVLIEVRAAGVAFPDVLLTRGEYQYKPPLPFVPGAEVAGVVVSAPAGSQFSPGQRVAAFPMFGGFAERVACVPELVFPLPDQVSFAEGAALPLNYLTVQFALVRRARLAAGQTVLVHGAAGGIGTAAIQLATALGAQVIAVVSTLEKGDVAQKAGARHVVLADNFLAAVKDLTGGAGVDVVVDPVGGDRFTDSLRALGPEGQLLVIGFTGGEIPTVKVNRLLLNNTSVVGVGWGAFTLPRLSLAREQWDFLLPHIASGALVPPVGATYPLSDLTSALRDIDERRATGKIVLTLE
ncbi:NADPH:quinone oxidoreductase family protein [Spongisporangium articulatum]|uniref:NADPH:quinone oxidoreductase family protein n=1 Tax=Spongisporangium articulatum TaxID=3362603 RepID=A0ABW8AHP4_9ACTN